MGAIVAYIDLLISILARIIVRIGAAYSIGKLEILGAVELLQHIAVQVKYEHTHHFALDDHNATLVVHTDAARMLQNIGAELAQELSVLVVDLYLMSRRSLGDHDVARLLDNAHSVRIEQLSVAFAALAKLELEAAVLVEDLYAMRVGVCHDDVIVGVYGDARRLRELAVVDAELAELAMVDHLGANELRRRRTTAAIYV